MTSGQKFVLQATASALAMFFAFALYGNTPLIARVVGSVLFFAIMLTTEGLSYRFFTRETWLRTVSVIVIKQVGYVAAVAVMGAQ